MRKFTVLLLVMLAATACKRKGSDQVVSDHVSAEQQPYGCCAPEILDTAWYTSGKKAPFFSGLEGIDFKITTANPESQQYFNQGLMLAFGFNHAEAARSFYEAARQDSACAMCWWGYAYVLGPNYNAGMDPGNFERANDAITKAKLHSSKATQKEKDLISAMAERYSADTTIERSILDSAYAAAMKKLYKKYTGDVNIGAMYAEAMMDMHPWDLFDKSGEERPWTPEIIAVLEKCLKQDPRHAGANHFYIHAVEMSNTAERSMASADLLRDLVPGSGHLVHMPSHTYIRTGRYHDGVIANQKAVEVDSLYFVACHAQGVYPLAYYPHNHHFISACATFSGESKLAMIGANATSWHANKKLMEQPEWATLQHYYCIPWYVQVKLGLWDDVLNSKAPDKKLSYPTVVWHYARGMARLSQGKNREAAEHLNIMKQTMKDTSLKELTIWGINSVYDLCEIAIRVLEGEIKAKEKKYGDAIKLLTEAVSREDALNYDEPPDWFFSVRHHLGAVLVEAGKYDEAIKVYEQDLKTYRNNGWALRGLMNAYEKKGDSEKFRQVQQQFNEAWKHADITIRDSRIL
jgi:tetratricopeptide (TPR) repeat protein